MAQRNRHFSMVEYFKRRSAGFEPELKFKGRSKADFDAWKQQLLGRLRELLGSMPEPVPLNPELIWEVEEDGIIKRMSITLKEMY